MKQFLIIFGIIVLIGAGGMYFIGQSLFGTSDEPKMAMPPAEDTETSIEDENDAQEQEDKTQTVIGQSENGVDITAYHFGEGEKEILFVGGIHGGYSWNTVLLAYEIIDYLEENTEDLPDDVRVNVIPVLNPDGLEDVVGSTGRFDAGDVPASDKKTVAGRFNANNVDLNRNFDCDWEAEGTWQNTTVDGGDAPFSESESAALKEYIEKINPDAVVVYYASAGGVFTSSCHNGVSDTTRSLTQTYANASGYKSYEEFDFYEITGDMVNWLAKEKIPAISVLLTNHTDIEWTKNKKGIDAIIEYISE